VTPVVQQAAPDVRLSKVRRICVERFGKEDDKTSEELWGDMTASLVSSKRFRVIDSTDNKDYCSGTAADAILKGHLYTTTSRELETSKDRSSTSVGLGTGHAVGIAGEGSSKTVQTERAEVIDDARLSVRLVIDGEVVWSTTQESKGAKYKGPVQDVADKVVTQLLTDCEKSESPTQALSGRARGT